MAIDVCSEISPRISFSHDLSLSDLSEHKHLCRTDSFLLDSSIEFNFNVKGSLAHEFSSADELFSNGKIRPIGIKKAIRSESSEINRIPHYPAPSTSDHTKNKSLKEILRSSSDAEEKPSSRSFWQFKRSSSLNCENARSRSLIRFLSRSNSTGSASHSKEMNQNQKQSSRKQVSMPCSTPPLATSTTYSYSYGSLQNPPPLKKNCRSSSNGVRINPVLNLPSPYISTVSLFGFGSLLCNRKDKKKKK